MAAVHRHEVDVDVDQQVAFRAATIQDERLFVSRLADLDETVGPLGVVVVITIGIVVGEDPRPDHALHFPLGHLPVQGIGDDDVNVVDAVTGEHVEHDLEHRLANVGRRHRRQRQTDVVNRDGDAHARFELRKQRIAAERMIERVTDGSFTIRQTFDRRVRIDHTRSDRQVFENEVFAGRHDARRAIAIDVDDGFVCLSSELKCHFSDFQFTDRNGFISRFSIGQS